MLFDGIARQGRGIVMKRLVIASLFVCMGSISPGRGAAMDIECLPSYRTDVDTRTVVDYHGSLRESVPLKKDSCERREGLIFADNSAMDYFGKVHYVPLAYIAEKSEPDSKFDGLVFPLDLTAEIEHDTRGESYQYSHFRFRVNVRQKGNGSIFFDEKNIPLLVRADKRIVSLNFGGLAAGIESFGVSMELAFELTPENMRRLLRANKYSFIVPFTHNRTEKEKGRFTVQLNLTDEGVAELKKFIKVALKYADKNEALMKKHKAK